MLDGGRPLDICARIWCGEGAAPVGGGGAKEESSIYARPEEISDSRALLHQRPLLPGHLGPSKRNMPQQGSTRRSISGAGSRKKWAARTFV